MKSFQLHRIYLSRPQAGFTLVELTIVMLIVSILLAGVLVPLSMQMETRRYADTKKTMDLINEALIGFVLVNGRLPCPASGTIANGTANAGTEALTVTVCTSPVGVIPWATLNVPETDEWGGRFAYRVSPAFADIHPPNLTWGGCTPVPTPAAPTSFALCSIGDLKVQGRTTAKVAYDMTNLALPAVYISHGKNGKGAFLSTGAQNAPAPNTTDEYTNSLSTTTNFINREKTDTSSSCSDTAGTTPMCEFDDLISFVPLTTLMNRMVISGKLP